MTTSRDLPASLNRWRRVPLVRGVLSLGESVALGSRATTWGARTRVPEEEGGVTRSGVAVSMVVAVVFAVGVFALLPAAVAHAIGPSSSLGFNLVEGGLRLGLLFVYLYLIGRAPQVQRVFAYHGAEHMTIHAFEHGEPLDAAHIRTFDRRHARCGTAFLLIVVIVSMLVHLVIGRPSLPILMLSRVLLLPVIAGIAYEIIRFAGRHEDTWYGRALMSPGFLLQGITTADPSDDMIEVAVAALRATLSAAGEPAPPTASPVGGAA